ncbi:protein mono-ADP-ribosyltransferase TIPARP-like isoform X2 [Oculina patagonica]
MNRTKEAKAFRTTFVQMIWNMLTLLYFKVSSAGKQSKQYFDALCSTDFRGKIIQCTVDYLSRHPSVDYAMKKSAELAVILIICGVALECFYFLRLIYWMVVNFFISALIFGAGMVFVLICSICSCLHAILKFLLAIRIFFCICYFLYIILGAILSGVVFIYLLRVWAFRVIKRLFISKRNDAKQKPGTTTTVNTATAAFPRSPLTPLNSGSPSMPYRWQFKEADSYQWSNFGPTDNVAIEKLYCDVENLQVNIVLKDTRSSSSRGLNVSTTVTVNFEQMSMHWLDTSAQFLLRRLSTPSYIQEPGNVLSTKWVWYWKDNDGWKKYAKTKQSTGTKQEDIEAAYLNEERIYFFQIGPSKYIITFYETSMYQRNMDPSYLTMRSVRRRPLFASQPALQTLQSDLTGRDMDFERIALGCGSREYQAARKLFHVTIPESKAKILAVEKVKNEFLLERYNRKREQMKKKLKANSYDTMEKLLFHGTTPDVIDAICKQNFDHRLRGKNGTVYGEGSYFAVNASYSNKYSSSQSEDKTRFMFLASVLTGEYKLGGRDLRRPPLKDPSNPASDLYDSCVDKEEDPKIFVIFNDEQCYPLFLIKYRLQ